MTSIMRADVFFGLLMFALGSGPIGWLFLAGDLILVGVGDTSR